jgi:hypothetical protein
MENEGITNILNIIDENRGVWNFAMFLFWGGVILLSLYIKKVNNLTYSETLLAAVGLRKVKRNWIINLGNVLVIVIPLGLMAYVISGGITTSWLDVLTQRRCFGRYIPS